MLRSMARRIEQSASVWVPASAAASAASRVAKSTDRSAFSAKENSMTENSRMRKNGKTRLNSTSDWPRRNRRDRRP